MKTVVIKMSVPDSLDIFDLHEQLENTDIDMDRETLAVYESVPTFMTDHREV